MAAALGVYVHLPWCERKCPYCDFNSYVGEQDEDAYVDALLRDLAFEAPDVGRRPVRSVFFGGGTPSLFGAPSIARIIDALAATLNLRGDAEITLEANPGSAEARRFKGYRAAGVNRLSIGVQSFDDAALKAIGRIHDAAGARRAIASARDAGFDNLNLDLMYALPGQDAGAARRDVETALAFEPEHLSYYELTLEPGTAFGRRPPQRAGEDARYEFGRAGSARIEAAGLRRYEVSAYAQPRRRSRHNLGYWRFADYLGIGAGAHGKLSMAGGVRRRAKLRSPQRYMATAGGADAIAREHRPDGEELRTEFALNALRLNDGFPLSLYARTTGRDPAELGPAIERATGLGLLRQRGGHLRPTALGRRHLNHLVECLA